MYRPGDEDVCKHGNYYCSECDGLMPSTRRCDCCEQLKPKSEVKLVDRKHICAQCRGEK